MAGQGMEGLVEPYNGAVKGGMPRHGGSGGTLQLEQLKGGRPRQGESGGTLQWSS